MLAVFLGRVACGSFKAGPASARPPGSVPVRRALAGRLLGSVGSGLWRDGERGRQGRRAAAEPPKRIRSPGPPAAGAERRRDERILSSGGGRGRTPLSFKGGLGVLHAWLLEIKESRSFNREYSGGPWARVRGLEPITSEARGSLTWGLFEDGVS